MVSDTAESDIEDLIARGLKPTVRDIVRLNAVALRIERGAYAAAYFALPRVAFLGDLALYQPTIGHETWLDKVQSIVDMSDDSDFACRLYAAATKDNAALVDPYRPKEVKAAVEKCLAAFSAFTFEQVRLALDYVETGGRHTDGESIAIDPADTEDAPTAADSVALGAVHDGVAGRLGISLRDLRSMTRGELLAVVSAAFDAKGGAERAIRRRQTEYFRTLDEISARLEKERANG